MMTCNSMNPKPGPARLKSVFRLYRLQALVCLLLLLAGFGSIPGYGFTPPGQAKGLPAAGRESKAAPDPEVVVPEKDGTLRLVAEKGRAIGPEIKYMPEWKAFGWFTAKDLVEWEVAPRKGRYEVFLEWSVSDKEAGKPFVISAGSQQLTGMVAPSGSWETFKTVKIGELQLKAGRQKVVFRPDSQFEKGALLDLREVRLVPLRAAKGR